MGRVSEKNRRVKVSKSKKTRSKSGGVVKRYEHRVDSIKFAHEVESFDFASEMQTFLNRLGKEGWRLVSLLNLGQERYHVVSVREVKRGTR